MAAERKYEKTPEEFVNAIETILSANVSKSIHLMTHATDLIKNTVKTVSSPGRASMDGSKVLERWLNFNVASFSVISDHALSMLDKLITVAEGAIVGNIPRKRSAEKQVDIEIAGQQGEKCCAVFLIQNHYDHALDISFETTPLVAESASTLSNAYVTFDPSSTSLEPAEQTWPALR